MNYCLMATYKCNWHCPYCITNTHMQEDVKDSEILKKLNEINIIYKKKTKYNINIVIGHLCNPKLML